MSATVSVIIPVYNGERFLADAIESAFAQTLAPHEVIIVDDGSSDATGEVAQRFPITYVRLDANQGVSTARNVAIERATGEYLAMLDSDDVWLADKLAVQVEALEADPTMGYVVSNIRYFVEPGAHLPAWFNWNSPNEDDDRSYPPSTWLLRRAVWDRVGLFDPARREVEDIDWLARANDLGIAWLRVPRALVWKRIRDDSLTANVDALKSSMLSVLRDSAARKRRLHPEQ